MKKFYTFILLMAVGAVSYCASAKNLTITVDDASRVVVRNPLDSYEPITFTNNSAVLEGLDDNSFLPVQANTGFQIESITDVTTGESVCDSRMTFPAESCQIYPEYAADGATVHIATSEQEVLTFTVVADHPEVLNVTFNYQTFQAEDGQFVVPISYKYSSLEISIADKYAGDYGLVKATASDGTEYNPYYGRVSIYAGSVTASTTITVETIDYAQARTATMNVEVDGNPEAVRLTRADNTEVSLSGENTAVKFDPNSETQFYVESAIYGKSLYKVELDGQPVSYTGRYSVTASDGCTLKITTDYPDVDVPVNFSFTNEGTEGVVRNVRVNNQIADWTAENFSVKLGSQLSIDFNTGDYENVSITMNGTTVSPYGFQQTVTSEEAISFVITATKATPYYVTFITDTPDALKVYNGSGYNESELLPLTGEETVLEISKSNPYITVKAASGYIIDYLIDGNGNDLYVGYSNYVSGDMEIYASAVIIERPLSFMMYVAPGAWTYRNITLSQSNNDLRVQYTDSQLPIGYMEVPFATFDLPLNISGYPTPLVYRNDEPAELEYGALNELEDGDVIKMFLTEPASFNVSYDIDSEVNLEVRHDHIRLVENPAQHSVFEGTEIVLTPVEAESPVARVAAAQGAPVITVNGEAISPREDGSYLVTVTDHTNIKAVPGELTGIGTIEAAIEADAPVYNLQGIRVGSASELRALPAGTYITGGMKIRK